MKENLEAIFRMLIMTGQKRSIAVGCPREVALLHKKDKICVCLGVRRCGKSTLMAGRMAELLAQGVSRENIVHINFADDRLLPLHNGGWDALYSAYYGMYPEKMRHETVYFFFDELQIFHGWELFVERLRRDENCEIYITGSSAALLSKEIHTALRGRSLSNELFPFSFGEYMERRGLARLGYDAEYLMQRRKAWHDYKQEGGFPEAYGENEELRRTLFQEYYDSLLYRDIVERHQISQPLLLRMFAGRLISNVGSLISVNKIQNILKSMGVNAARETLQQYLLWLEDAYFIFTLPAATPSAIERARSMRKIYAIDHAMVHALCAPFSDNNGPQLENMVYLALRRHTSDIYYYKTQKNNEVDFLVNHHGKKALIQVCADMSDEKTKNRELRALEEAMHETGIKQAYVITEFQTDTINTPIGDIQCLSALDFLAAERPMFL